MKDGSVPQGTGVQHWEKGASERQREVFSTWMVSEEGYITALVKTLLVAKSEIQFKLT